MIYFTSDLHFGHRGIIEMKNRPFGSTEEMNRVLLGNYNAMVQKQDTVYLLGDICHHMTVEQANGLTGKMNGRKILIRGNHDKEYDPALFEEICDFKTVSLNNQYFVLMHYPMLEWPKKHSGSIHLHGHIHAGEAYNLKNREEGTGRFDVGVDAWHYLPVSLKQLTDFYGQKGDKTI